MEAFVQAVAAHNRGVDGNHHAPADKLRTLASDDERRARPASSAPTGANKSSSEKKRKGAELFDEALSSRSKQHNDEGAQGGNVEQEAAAAHAFECDEDDHAETPLLAYSHVAPFLEQLARSLKKV
jgi:hypothetical protein